MYIEQNLRSPPHLANFDGRATLPKSGQDIGTLKRMTLTRKTSSALKDNRTLFEDDIHVCIQCLRAVMNSTVRLITYTVDVFLTSNYSFIVVRF